MGIHDRKFEILQVVSWIVKFEKSEVEGAEPKDVSHGILIDPQGCKYPVTLKDLEPECDGYLFPGEEVVGFILGFDYVSGVQPSDSLSERKSFDSVGSTPDVVGWEPVSHPENWNRSDGGRFSHPQERAEYTAPAGAPKISTDYAEGVSHTPARSAVPAAPISSTGPNGLDGLCHACATKIVQGAKFCHGCGEKV